MSTRYDTRSTILGAILVAAIATPALADTTSRETGKSDYPLQYSALDQDNAYLYLNQYKTMGTTPEGEQTVTRSLSDGDILLPEMQSRPRVQANAKLIAPQEPTRSRLSIRHNYSIGAFR